MGAVSLPFLTIVGAVLRRTIGVNLRKSYALNPSGPVGSVLRCTHPNAICIPNRTGDIRENPSLRVSEKMNIVMQTDMDPTLPRFRLGGFTHVGFRGSTRFSG